jgi:hypothetical protein
MQKQENPLPLKAKRLCIPVMVCFKLRKTALWLPFLAQKLSPSFSVPIGWQHTQMLSPQSESLRLSHKGRPVSNITVKASPAFGLRWTLRDKAPRNALYLKR